ncbi:helix-turn-helix domain-containing protein [Pseudonocardia oroxyli]|uniref:HTH cro/C1-type domain-containing protein n=1 Tax=Pseudonocardia oroxyli TaxID=366584 RepID=A0A1G7K5Z2_PSEOR|nr:helix-turn-helix transcriptional regulator [Pseudonocardia oroxyli]SDF32562.1 hypothetical protein SAMN05216377_104253 [Pseudonocardia oroxyli]
MDPESLLAANRERQRALYGAPIGQTVHRVVKELGITQGTLARTVGVSPAMLSQLVTGRRVKIGDPAVLARLRMLDDRAAGPAVAADRVPGLLAAVRSSTPVAWTAQPGQPGPSGPADRAGDPPRPVRPADPTEALRAVTTPARLVAAAAALGTAFPEIAALLRRAASN